MPESSSDSRRASFRSESAPEICCSSRSGFQPRCRRSRSRGTPHGRSAPGGLSGSASGTGRIRRPGRQREGEHPQRVRRQEPVDRETVASEFGVVALLSGIETAVEDNSSGIDGERRGDRECAPVGCGRAVEPDLIGNCHAAAQGRIGQQLHEEIHVAEIAFEAGRGVQQFGVEQVLRPAVGGEVEVSGRRDVEPDPPMSVRVPAAVSFIRTVRSFSAGGIAVG